MIVSAKLIFGAGSIFFLFTLNLGEMIDQFDKHMFQMGWFSHQLGRWWVVGGSSHDLVQWLIIMWDPIQMTFLWLANGGLLWRPKWLLLPKDCQKTVSLVTVTYSQALQPILDIGPHVIDATQ